MTPPGRAVIVVNGRDYAAVAAPDVLVFADPSSLAVRTPPAARLGGVYCDKADDISTAKDWALRLGTRLFANHDGPDRYPRAYLAQLRPWDLPSLELYWTEHEAKLADALTRWRTNLDDLVSAWPYQMAVTTQNYLGAKTEAQVFEMQPWYPRIVNDYRSITVVAPFAWDRANGLPATITILAAATHGTPVLVPVPVPPVSTFPLARVFKGATVGKTFKVYLKFRGKYIGIDPAHPDVVYADRTSANGWEAIILTQLDDKRFSAWFEAAQRFLSITDLGELQSRTSVGAWESHLAIDPPKEYASTPSQLFQPDHGTILEIEVRS